MSDPIIPEVRIQEFYEFWRKVRCPSCTVCNWIYDSHSQRHYPDIRDGVKCHSCCHIFWCGERAELMARHSIDFEEGRAIEDIFENGVNYYDGRPDPGV